MHAAAYAIHSPRYFSVAVCPELGVLHMLSTFERSRTYLGSSINIPQTPVEGQIMFDELSGQPIFDNLMFKLSLGSYLLGASRTYCDSLAMARLPPAWYFLVQVEARTPAIIYLQTLVG